MNRQIKFRAWNGKWMVRPEYGDWVSFDGVPYTEADNKFNTPHIEIQKAKDYVLMQFTGLKDKNGKEIYESDCVKILPSEMIGVVRWHPELALWEIYFEDGEEGYSATIYSEQVDGKNTKREVTGNIYEN